MERNLAGLPWPSFLRAAATRPFNDASIGIGITSAQGETLRRTTLPFFTTALTARPQPSPSKVTTSISTYALEEILFTSTLAKAVDNLNRGRLTLIGTVCLNSALARVRAMACPFKRRSKRSRVDLDTVRRLRRTYHCPASAGLFAQAKARIARPSRREHAPPARQYREAPDWQGHSVFG